MIGEGDNTGPNGPVPVRCSFGQSLRRLIDRASQADRRIWPRRYARFDVSLTHARTNMVIRARTADISSGGFYIVLAREVRLARGEPLHAQITASGDSLRGGKLVVDCLAAVTHSELLVGENDCQLGIGFEFDRPQTINPLQAGQFTRF